MATDYPIEITDPDGSVRIAGIADFTDPDNQPAAGDLFNGWTSDAADPANVSGGAGSLGFNNGTNNVTVSSGTVAVSDDEFDEGYTMGVGQGFRAFTKAGVTAFSVAGDEGTTTALDCGGLTIVNLPTSDPGIAGGLYTTGGTVLVSAG